MKLLITSIKCGIAFFSGLIALIGIFSLFVPFIFGLSKNFEYYFQWVLISIGFGCGAIRTVFSIKPNLNHENKSLNKAKWPNQCVWIYLEPETQILRSRTRRYSERTCLSRIVLRAAHSAPSTFVAELKRSAELFGIVFAWFQFSELYATSFSFRKDYRPSFWFWLSQVVVWL